MKFVTRQKRVPSPFNILSFYLGMKVVLTQILIYFLLSVAAISPAAADTVSLHGKPAFRNVEVLKFERGLLHFRGISREILRKPLSELATVMLDAVPMLSNAEALAQTEPDAAITAYELVLSGSDQSWVVDFALARLIATCERAGRFDEATARWVALLPENADWAADLAPRKAGEAGSAANRSARTLLSSCEYASTPGEVGDAIRSLWLELSLLDGLDPLPAELGEATRQPPPNPKPATASATQPVDLPPLMFGPVRQKTDPTVTAKPDEASLPREPVFLPRDSLVLAAAAKHVDGDRLADAARLIERSMPFVRRDDRDAWRLLAGRCDVTLGRAAIAADQLLALSRSASNAAIAAEALYYVAAAHERMDRADLAADIYRELAQKSDLPVNIRRMVEQRLKEIGD